MEDVRLSWGSGHTAMNEFFMAMLTVSQNGTIGSTALLFPSLLCSGYLCVGVARFSVARVGRLCLRAGLLGVFAVRGRAAS